MRILGTRKAIQDSLAYAHASNSPITEYLTYLCKIDKTHNTGTAAFALSMQFAKIRAAINDQKQPIPSWLHYAYGPDLEIAQKWRQKRMVARMLSLQLFTPPIAIKRRDRIERLCMCAVEDYRMGLFLGKTLPKVVYCELMDVHASNWDRDWGKLQAKALELIKALDSDGIGGVSVVVRMIREAELEIA